MPKRTIMVIFGTRPEAIKMAPVILELQKNSDIRTITVSTSQHREMLQQVLDLFQIIPDYDLQIMQRNQSLNQIVENAMHGFHRVFAQEKPDLILVQGDTTTAFVGALAGFYQRIPVGHIEAGLRSGNLYSPYPEEANRRMISAIASFHFAPTRGNLEYLLKEGVAPQKILVTGNTVIDALFWVLKNKPDSCFARQFIHDHERLILVTAHRRENFGAPIQQICAALRHIADQFPDIRLVYPVHLNQNIQQPVYQHLDDHPRITLLEPVGYRQLCALMNQSYLVLTDSGGIQEEAPALGKPVLVMRTETERPEAIKAGTVAIVGTDTDAIVNKTTDLLTTPHLYEQMAQAVNPYGDGHASERIVRFLAELDHAFLHPFG